MKCFIAMAFSNADTDAIYEKGIKKVLSDRGIESIRVDKLEHNENINDRIIEEIRSSDLAIADLTYARPSVYYEAGFAERSIPVIYTIRRDHFTPDAGDKFGNLKLHFDLSMKNIIDWASADDDVFASRLGSRIDNVIAPILEARKRKEAGEQKGKAFSKLTVDQRFGVVAQTITSSLNRHGFVEGSKLRTENGNEIYMQGWGHEDTFFATTRDHYRFSKFDFQSNEEKLPLINFGVDDFRGNPEYNLNIFHNLNTINHIEEVKIICSFHSIGFDQLCLANRRFSSDKERGLLSLKGTLNLPVVPDHFREDVFLGNQYAAEELFRKLWDGGKRYEGFYTKRPPSGMQYVAGDIYKEFQFVYKGFAVRKVDRVTNVYVLDQITSEDDLKERIEKIFESSL